MSSSTTPMTKDLFWSIIDETLQHSRNRGQYTKYLTNRLTLLKPESIFTWYNIFDYYLHYIYRDDFWNFAINQGEHATDDGFEYFTRWIVSRGHDVYMNALKDVNTLKKVGTKGNRTFEEVPSCACDAYTFLTGDELLSCDSEHFSCDWDFDNPYYLPDEVKEDIDKEINLYWHEDVDDGPIHRMQKWLEEHEEEI